MKESRRQPSKWINTKSYLYQIGKKCEINFFEAKYSDRERRLSSCHEHGTKILNPREESNPKPSGSAFPCSTTEPQRLYGK